MTLLEVVDRLEDVIKDDFPDWEHLHDKIQNLLSDIYRDGIDITTTVGYMHSHWSAGDTNAYPKDTNE